MGVEWKDRILVLEVQEQRLDRERGWDRRVLDRYAGAGLGAEARGLPHGGILVPGALKFSVVKKKNKKKTPMLWFHETTLWQIAEVVGVTMVIISLRFPVLAHSQTSKAKLFWNSRLFCDLPRSLSPNSFLYKFWEAQEKQPADSRSFTWPPSVTQLSLPPSGAGLFCTVQCLLGVGGIREATRPREGCASSGCPGAGFWARQRGRRRRRRWLAGR